MIILNRQIANKSSEKKLQEVIVVDRKLGKFQIRKPRVFL